MSAFNVPAPSITPLRLPPIGKSKVIDSETQIALTCATKIPNVRMFYTVDGTVPQPYIAIAQGSKTYKYNKPFSLPVGKIIIKAIALHRHINTISSNIVTKQFHVLDAQRTSERSMSSAATFVTRNGESNTEQDNTYSSDVVDEEEMETIGEFLVDKTEGQNDSSTLLKYSDNLQYANGGRDPTESFENYVYSTYADVSVQTDVPFEAISSSVDPHVSVPHLIAELSNHLSQLQCHAEIHPHSKSIVASPCQPAQLLEQVPSAKVCDAEIQCDLQLSSEHEILLNHYLVCKNVNMVMAKYCDQCGINLFKICDNCHNQNIESSNFCRNCGQTFLSEDAVVEEPVEQKDVGIVVKPYTANDGTDVPCLFISANTSTQTEHRPLSNKTLGIKRMPQISAGQGYWRQQVDYICSYLKIHTNNNLAFQTKISQNRLRRLLDAVVDVDENKLSLRLEFDFMPSAKHYLKSS